MCEALFAEAVSRQMGKTTVSEGCRYFIKLLCENPGPILWKIQAYRAHCYFVKHFGAAAL